ncbi:MAG: hypothetical protein KBT34_13295 [Prevotella sp.]|nr:hypothetical protein [Candidatus Prevotella equi]
MTLKDFVDTNWHRGNVVKLMNGKEYLVKGVKGHGRWLLLYSEEFDAKFVADYRIVDCRTSDYEEPEEVYLEMKRQKQAEAEARREAERQEYLRAKAERKQKNIEAQERAHQEALARKAANRQKNGQAKVEPKTEVKPVAPVESKKVEAPKVSEPTPKAVEPAPEAPKKRLRKRIRITAATPVREKVEFFKKK